jgi:hypothetical protein
VTPSEPRPSGREAGARGEGRGATPSEPRPSGRGEGTRGEGREVTPSEPRPSGREAGARGEGRGADDAWQAVRMSSTTHPINQWRRSRQRERFLRAGGEGRVSFMLRSIARSHLGRHTSQRRLHTSVSPAGCNSRRGTAAAPRVAPPSDTQSALKRTVTAVNSPFGNRASAGFSYQPPVLTGGSAYLPPT